MTGTLGTANGNGIGSATGNGHGKEPSYVRPDFMSEAVKGKEIDGSESILHAPTMLVAYQISSWSHEIRGSWHYLLRMFRPTQTTSMMTQLTFDSCMADPCICMNEALADDIVLGSRIPIPFPSSQ